MNWFYVDAGQQAGPVDEGQLAELERAGKVQGDTLVWREGMANWQPYNEVQPPVLRMAAAPPLPAAAALPLAANQAVCAECGRVFEMENMIAYGGIHVCAECKPVFMQKLAEGAQLSTGALNYAGFWTRFGAVFLDGLILAAVNLVVSLAAGLGLAQAVGVRPTDRLALQLVLILVRVVMGLAYEVVLIGRFGATLGKMACRIKVVTAEGGQVSYLRAFGRYWAKGVSAIICLAGYIMAAFDDEKRALHDRMCNTRVVFK